MASVFTKIIQGEIPCHKIAENEDFFAFLDIFPVAQGHTLVVPKKEVDYLFDLDESTYLGLHLFAKKIVPALQQAVPCVRIATAVVGLEVPHAHLHLIPINSMKDMNFNHKLSLSQEQLAQIAADIRKNISAF